MKIKEKLKKNKRFLFGFLLGILISSGSVYAASIISKDVSYDNSNSKLTSTNVQGAIDELYKTATDKVAAAKEECPSNFSCINKLSFSDDSWETISSNIKNGKSVYYRVGDEKEIDMGEFGKHMVRVANISECTNGETSKTACGFVIEFSDIITSHNMNSKLPPTNSGGWPTSDMRTFLNDTIFNSLPEELQNVIVSTTVISELGSNYANPVSSDKLYLLSAKEIWNVEWDERLSLITKQLDYYKYKKVTDNGEKNAAIKKYNNENYAWWLRSADRNSSMTFGRVTDGGGNSSTTANGIYGVSPAFRIE